MASPSRRLQIRDSAAQQAYSGFGLYERNLGGCPLLIAEQSDEATRHRRVGPCGLLGGACHRTRIRTTGWAPNDDCRYFGSSFSAAELMQ
jgi:hypothetical protein